MLAISIVPLVNWLIKNGIPQWLAFLLTFFAILTGGSIIITVVGISISDLIDKLPLYESQMSDFLIKLKIELTQIGITIPDRISFENIEPKKIFEIGSSFVIGIGRTLSNSVLIILFIILILFELIKIQKKLNTGNGFGSELASRIDMNSRDLRKYLSIAALTGLIVAAVNFILLTILGVSFPVLWSVISFFMNFIPTIGIVIALIPPAIIALLELGTVQALIVVIGFLIINFVAENVIKPVFMKEGLNLSLFIIFLSLIFWSWVLGFTGAILAVPLTLVARNIIREIYQAEITNET
jgi:predicted PurR-regulated permease PerM